jgi:hypothetical protein
MLSKRQVLICLLLYTVLAFAKTGQEAAKKTHTVAITGCLQKGMVAGRFNIVGRDGKSYSIRSASVKLVDHVGRRITVTGQLKRDPKRDDYDFEGSEVNEENGKGKIIDPVDVEVINLKVLSNSCH